MPEIEKLKSKNLTLKDVEALNKLEAELRGGSFDNLDILKWKSILAANDVRVIVIRESGAIIGMAILRWHDLPHGKTGNIEDVVVDSAYRGRGYGQLLAEEAIKCARAHNIDFIDLTSHPSREAANKLYRKLGWEKKDTNFYRLYPNKK